MEVKMMMERQKLMRTVDELDSSEQSNKRKAQQRKKKGELASNERN